MRLFHCSCYPLFLLSTVLIIGFLLVAKKGSALMSQKDRFGLTSTAVSQLKLVFTYYNWFPTFTRFPVSGKSWFTGTKIRSFSVLTVGIDVTWGRRSIALVDIY